MKENTLIFAIQSARILSYKDKLVSEIDKLVSDLNFLNLIYWS